MSEYQTLAVIAGFALVIGLLSGTYSTIFIASPVMMWLWKRERPEEVRRGREPSLAVLRDQRVHGLLECLAQEVLAALGVGQVSVDGEYDVVCDE